jgi:hypothetical protein
VARYSQKNEADLAWNRIRREVVAKVHLAAANWKEEKLNEILPRLQDEFEKSLIGGEILEIEASHETWVDEVLQDASSS